MIQYVAGLDVGGTSGRMKLICDDGGKIGEYYGTGCSINTVGQEQSESIYRRLVLSALQEYGLAPEGCRGVCVAASGVDSPELAQVCRNIFLRMGFDESVIIIQNDCEIFLNLPGDPSLVLVAGTGSISFGKTGTGTVVRSGGWNHILSDGGSAFGIGLEVIRHVGNHLDGREACPVLYREFYQKTGIKRLYELDCFINENLMDKGAVGEFALLAERSCRAGEAAGAAIIEAAAVSLFELVQDTYRKMNLKKEEECYLWLWGSVLLKCEPLRLRTAALITDCYRSITIKIPPKAALEIAADVAWSYARR